MKKKILIKVGGEMLSKSGSRRAILRGVVRLAKKNHVILVHGGGPQIGENLKIHKIPIRFVNGRRFTSPAGMDVVEQVLSGLVNKQIVADMVQLGARALGLSGRDGGLLMGRLLPRLGRAAQPISVQSKIISDLLDKSFLPVISSVGSDSKGRAVNINADDAASLLAEYLKVDRLIFLTEVGGVLDSHKKKIPLIRIGMINQLIKAGVVSGGMIPKLQSARHAIRKGVGAVEILNGRKGIISGAGTVITK